MAEKKNTRKWAAITGIGTVISLLSLWRVWIVIPAEVSTKRRGYADMAYPEWKNFAGGQFELETGLRGAIDMGILMPSHSFIILLVIAGALSFLSISRLAKIPYPIIPALIACSMLPLTYWVIAALALECEVWEGYGFALVGAGLILFPAIKNQQELKKASQS